MAASLSIHKSRLNKTSEKFANNSNLEVSIGNPSSTNLNKLGVEYSYPVGKSTFILNQFISYYHMINLICFKSKANAKISKSI